MNFEKRFPLRDYSDKSKARLLSRNWILSRSQPPIGPLAVCLTSYAKGSVRFWDGYVWIMRRSIRSFNILLPLRTTHGSVVLARGWTIWTLLSWGEEFELEVSSLSSQEPSGAQVFILNIEAFQFEVRSSLSEGHGLEENFKNVHVLKLGRWILKVTVANFVFSKRLIIKFGTWVGYNFGPNGREFEQNNFRNFKCPGVVLRGGAWLVLPVPSNFRQISVTSIKSI